MPGQMCGGDGGAKGTRNPNPLLANSERGRRKRPSVRAARREPAVAVAHLTTRCSSSWQYAGRAARRFPVLYRRGSSAATDLLITSRPSRVTVEPPPLSVPRLSHSLVQERPAFLASLSPISGMDPRETPHWRAASSNTCDGKLLPLPTGTVGRLSCRHKRSSWSCFTSPPSRPDPRTPLKAPSSSPRQDEHHSGFIPCRQSSAMPQNVLLEGG